MKAWAAGGTPLALLLLAAIGAACAGGETEQEGEASPANEAAVPVIISSDLAVGTNRFVLGLLTADNEEVIGAQVNLGFFTLEGEEAVPQFEKTAEAVRITKTYTEIHEGGVVHTHEAGETGVYVASVEFDAAGPWGVEVAATVDGQALEPERVGFEVREQSLSPPIGAPAPRSRQLMLADVGDDITKIDTSDPPNPEMHRLTIADAVASGRPTVVVFATPAFCVSRICGPVKQIVDQLYEKYKDQANFIHVEPYDLAKAVSGEGLFPLPVVEEWGLQSEPWLFVIDKDGNVAAKFEGVVSPAEAESSLQQTLGNGANIGY